MWLGDGVDADFEEITKGVNVTVSAVQDDEEDWVITEISLAESKKKTGRKAGKK
jgi:hypothetical protein